MVVKCSLFFRSFLVKKDSNGNDVIMVNFLDENDTKYIFSFPLTEENKKYMKMQRDTKVDLDLVLYQPTKQEAKKYNIYVR